MIKLVQGQIKKATSKKWLIAICIVIALAVITIGALYIIRITSLSRALKSLDIEEQETVVKVMKYGGKSEKIVLDIAQKYKSAKMNTDCARLCIYAIQYLGSESAKPILESALVENGVDEIYVSQFDSESELSDFKIQAECGFDGYGIADGIYTEFLGGYAKAKISSVIPIEIFATENGAIFLDSTDLLIKSISRDGSKITVQVTEKANEFVYKDSQIYYIDTNGKPHGIDEITLSDCEYTQNLRVEGDRVVCTVYGADGESIREIDL